MDAEELGGADVHCRKSGVSDYYAEKDEKRATVFDTIAPSDLTLEMIEEILNKKNNKQSDSLGVFPQTKENIFIKNGRYGTYLQTGDKMKSLPPQLKEEDINLDVAIQILSLPKDLGKMGENNDSVVVDIGRYGPYIRSGKTTRSIPNTINILNMKLNDAVKILSSKNSRGSSIIKTLGQDKQDNDINIKNGRY